MTRRVFFSFHFEHDAWRAGIVRNSRITKEIAGFTDAANWEKIASRGDDAIKRWIKDQLDGTSVTVVLIGAETSTRNYVKYELEQSWKKDNGILGIYIHKLKNQYGNTDTQGKNHFGSIFTSYTDDKKYFFQRFPTYYWLKDDGYNNIDSWIEAAAKRAGK